MDLQSQKENNLKNIYFEPTQFQMPHTSQVAYKSYKQEAARNDDKVFEVGLSPPPAVRPPSDLTFVSDVSSHKSFLNNCRLFPSRDLASAAI